MQSHFFPCHFLSYISWCDIFYREQTREVHFYACSFPVCFGKGFLKRALKISSLNNSRSNQVKLCWLAMYIQNRWTQGNIFLQIYFSLNSFKSTCFQSALHTSVFSGWWRGLLGMYGQKARLSWTASWHKLDNTQPYPMEHSNLQPESHRENS